MARSIHVPGLEHGANPIPAASRRGPLLATGGVHGNDPDSGAIPDDARDEIRHALTNLGTILHAGGAGWADVVHVAVSLTGAGARELLNEQWTFIYPDPDARPARHVTIRPLPAGMTIQIEALAFVTGDSGA
jgi:2-iminobutanoate/2-iminopropanoate deaminase